jgi:glycogen synthase
MRVTLVTETYFPQVNGVSRTLGQLVHALTRMGDQVQIVHPDYGEPPGNEEVVLVIMVMNIKLPTNINKISLINYL